MQVSSRGRRRAMYVYREEGGLLSLLNGGRGMVKGGVGLSCLDSGKSLTLAGTSILRPSERGNGTSAAPYRTRELAIPQAYVMQRGHKVFFTAAEDMVIGSKCNLIQRELQERERVCREVVDVTMTTSRLNEKAAGYEETDERMRDTLPPGHYNKFYLDYLRKNRTHDEPDVFEGGIRVDELEGGIRKDLPPATNSDTGGRGVDADSGIGASNVTSTDRLTPFSDMTMFSGPGGTSTTLLTPHKGETALDFAVGASVDKTSVAKGKKGSKAKKSKGKKAKKTKAEPKTEEPKAVTAKKKKGSTKGSKKAAASDSTAGTASRSSLAKKQGQTTKKRCPLEASSSTTGQEKAAWDSGRHSDSYSRVGGLELEDEGERQRLLMEETQRREQHNTAMWRDLNGLQTGQSISRPWTFSYFCYVPPSKVKESKKPKAGAYKSK